MTSVSTPLYFPSGGGFLFGWLHQPAAELRTDVGLIVCEPFGYEAICAHRSLRTIADACAGIGVATLRFDYAGTGDSTDIEDDEEQISRWCGDILAAVEELRRRCGVRRVYVLGVRLGALLASLAPIQGAVDGLIALVPVVNGRRYLRELRAYQAGAAADGPPAAADGTLEVAGFFLSAASVARLTGLDLLKVTSSPQRVLILDRSDLPAAGAWADGLRALGAEVDYRSLPGFPEMVSTPHAALTPQLMLDALLDWLRRLEPVPLSPSPSPSRLPSPTAAAPVEMHFRTVQGVELIERAVFLDSERRLFAIVCAAASIPGAAPPSTRRGVVLLNAGATSHVGPNRMYVELSRQWAARGYSVLRLDLAGLGDSNTRPGRPDNEVYPPRAIDDIALGVEYLRREHGVESVTLAGLCAGAYHALRSATAGLAIDTLLMINPLTFYWQEGMTLSDLQIGEVVRNPGIYAERIFEPRAWRRVLRGHVNLPRIAAVFRRRIALAVGSSLRDVGRLMNIHFSNDLGSELNRLARQHTRMVFIFARGEAGATLLRLQGGSALTAIVDNCRVHSIDGADHIFSQSLPRRELQRLLSSELSG
ncbi:MAG: alpha/beta fold hydrolase [Gammaproteobacteria bacterium]